jgi:sugar/nucleoside kinase (ribokinase family)
MPDAVAAPDLSGHIAGTDVILVDGHYPVLAAQATRVGRARRVPVVVDAGRWKPVMKELITHDPEMICSNDFHPPGVTDTAGTARALRRSGVTTVVVTHGSDDVEWWTETSNGRVRPPAVRAVDTLGAGDVFHGAYAYYRCIPEVQLAERLARAARIAALRCSYWGIRTWISHWQQAETRPL